MPHCDTYQKTEILEVNRGKGKKERGGKATQFKKGYTPYNYKPVGTEIVNADGYIEVKLADPSVYKKKHILIWETEHGPVPKGHVIIFGDKNKRNFALNNLILVSRRQLAILNKYHLIKEHADLTRAGLVIADLHMKINERKKSGGNKKCLQKEEK